MKFYGTLTLFLLCLFLAGMGCATSKQYQGAERPSNKIATIICHKDGYIREIDGKWRGIGFIRRWDFLPGQHTLTVGYAPIFSVYRSNESITLLVNLEAGHRYDLTFITDITNEEWSAVVKDAASGETVSQDTRAAYAQAVKNAYAQALMPLLHMTAKTTEGLTATISVTVKRDGSVLSTKILHSSGDQRMDDAVRNLLRNVKHVPPFEDGAKDKLRVITIDIQLTREILAGLQT